MASFAITSSSSGARRDKPSLKRSRALQFKRWPLESGGGLVKHLTSSLPLSKGQVVKYTFDALDALCHHADSIPITL